MVHTRSEREIEKIASSCQIVADTLIMLEPFIVDGACVTDLDKMAVEYLKYAKKYKATLHQIKDHIYKFLFTGIE